MRHRYRGNICGQPWWIFNFLNRERTSALRGHSALNNNVGWRYNAYNADIAKKSFNVVCRIVKKLNKCCPTRRRIGTMWSKEMSKDYHAFIHYVMIHVGIMNQKNVSPHVSISHQVTTTTTTKPQATNPTNQTMTWFLPVFLGNIKTTQQTQDHATKSWFAWFPCGVVDFLQFLMTPKNQENQTHHENQIKLLITKLKSF